MIHKRRIFSERLRQMQIQPDSPATVSCVRGSFFLCPSWQHAFYSKHQMKSLPASQGPQWHLKGWDAYILNLLIFRGSMGNERLRHSDNPPLPLPPWYHVVLNQLLLYSALNFCAVIKQADLVQHFLSSVWDVTLFFRFHLILWEGGLGCVCAATCM